jgi:hypothetical protein
MGLVHNKKGEKNADFVMEEGERESLFLFQIPHFLFFTVKVICCDFMKIS